MNLPNKITLSRIFLVPVFMLFVIPIPQYVIESSMLSFMTPQLIDMNELILQYGNYIAAAIFILAASTDGVDGYIARKRKLVTNFGENYGEIAAEYASRSRIRIYSKPK